MKKIIEDHGFFEEYWCFRKKNNKAYEGEERMTAAGGVVSIGSFHAVKSAIISSLGLSDESKRIVLACEEIFSNIVIYSDADDVKISGKCIGETYSVTFSDNGVPFDPMHAELIEKDFEELDTGGMGIRMAKMIADEMTYSRQKNRNILTLKFAIRESGEKS